MGSRLSEILLMVLFIYAGSHAATYYVSSSGDDTNAGTAPDASWQNCPGMPGWSGSATLQAGDTVFFNNVDTWEVSSGLAVLQVTGGVFYDGTTWGTGSRAIFRAKADLNRSVIAMLKDDATIPTVVKGFEADAGGTITTGIGMNHPQMENTLQGATKRIEDCIVHDVMSSSAQGTYKYGIVISNWGAKYQVKNVEILDCKVYNISRGCINLYPGNDTGANWVENVLVRGNECWASGMDPDYGGSILAVKNHVINAVVEYNYAHDPVRGIGMGISNHPEPGFTGPENLIFRHNIIVNSKHAGIYIQDGGDKSITMYGNIIINSKYQGIILTEDLTGEISMKIYNNTLYNNYTESEWSAQIRVLCKDATITALEISNNLIYSTGPGRALLDDYGVITEHVNNCYYKTEGGNLVIANGTTYTAADITTWEPTAVTDDPLLFNTAKPPTGFIGTWGVDLKPNTDGFNLTGNSPAKDKGAALADSVKGSINTVDRPFGSGWDIGAYEFNGVLDVKKAGKSVTDKQFSVVNTPKGILFKWYGGFNESPEINIFDVSGKCVKVLMVKKRTGVPQVLWDGCNAQGVQCSPGCYIICVKGSEGTVSRRLVKVF